MQQQAIKARPFENYPTTWIIERINNPRVQRMDPVVGQFLNAELMWRKYENTTRQPGQKFAYER